MKTFDPNDRSEYRSTAGIAAWWPKDGLWHIALPCSDPDPVTQLKTGGFRWTENEYQTKGEAVMAVVMAEIPVETKPKLSLLEKVTAMPDEKFERWMKRNGYRGMAAVALSHKRRLFLAAQAK